MALNQLMLTVTWLPKALLASNFPPFIAFICQTINGIWRLYCFSGNSEFDPPKAGPSKAITEPPLEIFNCCLKPFKSSLWWKRKKFSLCIKEQDILQFSVRGAAERNLTAHTYPSLQMAFWAMLSALPDCHVPFARLADCLAAEMKVIWSIMQATQELMGVEIEEDPVVTHLYP